MSDIVIRAKDLRKVYRLYPSPRHRFLDMFGLLRNRPGAFTEHAALDGINLEIRRGEKIAFIGRNGAGKSTLLKLITHVIDPTDGLLEVSGKAHALLQIGSGFHPDFTGRENVYAYLAQLGVTGRDADRKFQEIVEFSELEEYISQPVKTYSSGMAVRLMFSTSTAITPDLLVLDEVLGVGDAYFAHKSYERIRHLCESEGTTLLLVTHDIYSAVKLCTRIIWIDRGRVMMDGDGPEVVKWYEDSVRQQEENRLRTRKQQRLEDLAKQAPPQTATSPVLVEIYAHENHPQPSPIYISRLAIVDDERAVAEILLGSERQVDHESHVHLEGTSWSAPLEWQARASRAFKNFGSPFHKVAAVFQLRPDTLARLDQMRLRVDHWTDQPCDAHVRAFVGDRQLYLGALSSTTGVWTTDQLKFRTPQLTSVDAGGVNEPGRHGTGSISVVDIKALDDTGAEAYVLQHGRPATILIRYTIHDATIRERSQVVLVFHRDGITNVARMITRDLWFDASEARTGEIQFRLPKVILGDGTYSVTVLIAREGYYDREQTIYFSLNPEVYTCLSRVLELVVTGGGLIASGTGVIAEGEWRLQPDQAPR